MAGSWQVVFFVLVLTCDCATIRNVLALEPKETLTRTRIKSEAQNCHVLEVKDRTGHHNILDTKTAETSFIFYILPQPGFNGLVFRAKVNNKISPGSWKYFKESLFVSSSRMEIDWTHPMWIPVEINYFKTEVSFGPDRHALKVKVGKSVDKNLITRWWRTHSYEGFAVEAEGPVKILFNCNPSSAKAESVIDTEGQAHTVLIASLCGCFLLVVGSATLYFLIMRRSPLLQDYPGNTPTSLTLLRGRPTRKNESSENIYESIQESTLKNLRQNLTAGKLSSSPRDPCSTTTTMDRCSGGLAERNDSMKVSLDSIAQMPDTAQDALTFSLLEEKEALRDYFGLDSPVESHYVEMHGIVSRTSSLSK
ncbi:uncharacterized protein LOC123505340 [Portunus trituberculatus]|uniref:uncharacterized protein LOC123505340 n=1 Tax=Portunus trituberculatus TaxID=210409 RepID=UPI001E1CE8A0|nr:uncharacterized protein LOC123505340 [Portunus trituberculatus]